MNVILRQVPSRYRPGFYYVCHKCDYYVENDIDEYDDYLSEVVRKFKISKGIKVEDLEEEE